MQVQQEFAMMKLSASKNVAATFGSNKACKVHNYAFKKDRARILQKITDYHKVDIAFYTIFGCIQNVMMIKLHDKLNLAWHM
jgi:uncharacterized protein YcgL (UPF0745 family)